MIKSFDELISTAISGAKRRVALAAAEDAAALTALIEARKMGIADCLLVGNQALIEKHLDKIAKASFCKESMSETSPAKMRISSV